MSYVLVIWNIKKLMLKSHKSEFMNTEVRLPENHNLKGDSGGLYF